MTSFKRYFFYHFRSTLLRGAVIAVISIALTMAFVTSSLYQRATDIYIYTDVGFLGVAAATLCTVLPILELMDFKKRRNLDTLFFLPVSRAKMSMAHYINGLIQTLIIVTLCFITAFIKIVPLWEYLNLIYLLPLYGLFIPLCLAIYSTFCFIFIKANTTADGIVFMITYAILGFFLVTAIGEATDIEFIERSPTYYFIYSPITLITSEFEGLIAPTVHHVLNSIDSSILYTVAPHYSVEFDPQAIVSFVFWGLVGLACIFGYVLSFARQKAENVGGISSTWFGYRTLIPLCAVCMLLVMEFDGLTGVVTATAMTVAYIVYRRSFKLKMFDVAITLAVFLVTVCGAIF